MFKTHASSSLVVCPQRRKDLLVQAVDGETLLYDEARHKAFCLNAVAAAVWQQCDGVSTVAQIASATAVREDIVLLALEDLHRDSLLEASAEHLPAAMLSRRQMAVKLGIGAAMTLPVVAAIAAPKAAQAYSGCVDCGDTMSKTPAAKF